MKLLIDCEFNSYQGQLLSMAIIDMKGELFYSELEIYEELDPWVKDNVSLIVAERSKDTYPEFQQRLEGFLSQYTEIHLVADWPEDVTYFTKALITGPGTRINTPPLTLEIRRDLDAISKNPHNAIADVIAMQEKYCEVTGTPIPSFG